jgi:hypothetical protein
MAECKENKRTKPVSVLVENLPIETHNKVLEFRKALVKQAGEMVTIRQAYREYLIRSKALKA